MIRNDIKIATGALSTPVLLISRRRDPTSWRCLSNDAVAAAWPRPIKPNRLKLRLVTRGAAAARFFFGTIWFALTFLCPALAEHTVFVVSVRNGISWLGYHWTCAWRGIRVLRTHFCFLWVFSWERRSGGANFAAKSSLHVAFCARRFSVVWASRGGNDVIFHEVQLTFWDSRD